MEKIKKLMELFLLKDAKLSSIEYETLFADLLGAYVCKTPSHLTELLMRDDLKGFQDAVLSINEDGQEIKEIINEISKEFHE